MSDMYPTTDVPAPAARSGHGAGSQLAESRPTSAHPNHQAMDSAPARATAPHLPRPSGQPALRRRVRCVADIKVELWKYGYPGSLRVVAEVLRTNGEVIGYLQPDAPAFRNIHLDSERPEVTLKNIATTCGNYVFMSKPGEPASFEVRSQVRMDGDHDVVVHFWVDGWLYELEA